MVDAPEDGESGAQPIIPGLSEKDSLKAAILIQKSYRGHRARRQLKGFGLDATTRWYEAVKVAKYQQLTIPRDSAQPYNVSGIHGKTSEEGEAPLSPTRKKWFKATEIARRAAADDQSPSVSDLSSDESDGAEEAKRKRQESNELRKKTAKMMDLQYFLEMVDQKHRYGSNLRKYHNYWKAQDTTQNFFYWLDQGDGRNVSLPECSRERLDKEQVRYLSREERLNYLVKVNSEGLLVWAKNGELVWTKDELYKDSINGIVPVNDSAPKWQHNVPPTNSEGPYSSSSDDSSDESSEDGDGHTAGDEGERYVNEGFHRAKGPAKLKHVSAAVLFNHMIRTSLKKGHKWIFVNTSLRLYIGYKQSGAFQHSSFLHGARILAAGLIKIKRGQLRRLSPLSGHYRPPANNFRTFVHSLRDMGVDMSHVSISRSYAILIGLESYTKTRKKIKLAERKVVHEKDKLINPAKVKAEEEAQQDKSMSAEMERLHLLEQQREAAEARANERKADRSISGRLSRAMSRLKPYKESEERSPRRLPGTGPEDGIPAPEGQR
ncbi:hypothetical protein PV08_00165 [Exophiala spinifera]|uniref:IQ domain-containing protein IQM6 n=1 Tax=Exophiala spinifera TaxID=91928 RepID=A0A0D2A413_9EURO|nr:uncharacterized protein PV08_00165 [Exophiala spinifera]KIW19592.1 hypothetical protein PV08_00165 [Exophiala spinifera]